jgi:hypothetical protein
LTLIEGNSSLYHRLSLPSGRWTFLEIDVLESVSGYSDLLVLVINRDSKAISLCEYGILESWIPVHSLREEAVDPSSPSTRQVVLTQPIDYVLEESHNWSNFLFLGSDDSDAPEPGFTILDQDAHGSIRFNMYLNNPTGTSTRFAVIVLLDYRQVSASGVPVLVQVPPHSRIKVPVVFDPDNIPRDSVSELMVLAASNPLVNGERSMQDALDRTVYFSNRVLVIPHDSKNPR